jgi:hypothetical protein
MILQLASQEARLFSGVGFSLRNLMLPGPKPRKL